MKEELKQPFSAKRRKKNNQSKIPKDVGSP
jgi:hypothetical protein